MRIPKSKTKYFYIGFAIAFLVLFALQKAGIDVFPSQQTANNTKKVIIEDQDVNRSDLENPTANYFLPTSTTGDVISHNTYYLSYSEQHEQAEWVAYVLKKEDIQGDKHKRPYFNQDPKVNTRSAHWNNYKNSGYTRGHLLPAGDRIVSKEAYNETFYTSNISPQLSGFNTGIWNSLEMKVRNFVRKKGNVYVVTAGVLSDNLKTIGTEKVAVPEYFYKILLYKNGDKYKMISFLIPHSNQTIGTLKDFVVTTDSIEQVTGIDFYPFLEDTLEEELESKLDYNWFFN